MFKLKKICPLLIVEKIEPCLSFWNQLGFVTSVTVPEGDKIGFVILEKDGLEIMYQSLASVKNDLPVVATEGLSKASLYIAVDSLADILKLVTKDQIVVPLRTTFYGANEIFVKEPGGNVVGFSEHGKKD